MSAPYRIDVHHHLVPRFWAEAISSHGGDPSDRDSPAWSPAASLAFMDTQQIATAVLSLDASGATGWQGEARRDMARRVNEFGAELVAWRPDRFGSFATLPLPDIDTALHELEYAFDTLGADGVVLLSNYAGRYLGDPVFDPFWAELDRREAVVFIHPAKPAIPVIEGVPVPIVDYPFDTTRTAVHLVMNGVMARCPQVKIILSHAGSFLPYHAHRFAELASVVRTDESPPADLLESFRSFYFDTALSSSPVLLRALQSFALPAHILYGSDFPYTPAPVGAFITAELDGFEGLTPRTRVEINSSAARTLFAGLAPGHDTAPQSHRSAAHVSRRLSALLTSFQ
jgi:predicted TIM-barrel fold metal-dependent hydrolase